MVLFYRIQRTLFITYISEHFVIFAIIWMLKLFNWDRGHFTFINESNHKKESLVMQELRT